jgi:hypothetical protein
LSTERVIAVFALTAIWQALFQQLTQVVPAELTSAAV